MVNVVVSTAGTSGPRGNGWLSGSGAPADSLGINGDFYVNNANPNNPLYYGPKTAGTWTGHGPYTFAVGGVNSLTAADTSIVLAGTGTNPTIRTNTLDVVATDQPPAADWSNNNHKITAVATGTASTDVAVVGQLPAYGPWLFNVTSSSYGAVGDAQVVGDGAMLSGSAILTSATANWPSTVVGKSISVKGAGPSGVTTAVGTVSSWQSATQITLSFTNTSGGNLTNAVVIWGTDDTAHIQAAINAAEAYLNAGNSYAQVYFPPRAFIVAGALNTSKSGNGQLVFGVYPTTGDKKILEFRGETDGAAAVRHWQQTVPQFAGSCLLSFGFYSSTSAQTADINLHGNPGVISGPNEGSGYGVNAVYSNVMAVVKNLAIGSAHTAFGITYGAFNLYGCANAYIENVGAGTLGTVASPSTDYTSPVTFASGLSIAALLPADGNNDHNVVNNFGIGGGFTYGLFLTEHGLVNRYMALYCWAGLVAVGNYFGSVGATHAMKVLQASIESCTQELYIYGGGSGGVGPIIDVDQLQTESGAPTIAGSSSVAVNSALGVVNLTGLFTAANVTVSAPTGLKVVNKQMAQPSIVINSNTLTSYQVTIVDRTILVNATTAPVTITLIDAQFTPNEYTIIKTDNTANAVTVAAKATQTINGAATQAITTQYGTMTVYSVYNGTAYAWYKK